MSNLAALLVVLALVCASVGAWSTVAARGMVRSHVGAMTMKGKGSRVPIDQRGEYIKQQRMMEAKKQQEGTKPDGVPVFKIFVRPRVGGLWVPCGDLAGDNRATALVNAWLSGFLEDTYKTQLDKGVAKSIFAQEEVFTKTLIENYKPFKRFTAKDLEFGYKVAFDGVEEKKGEQKVTVLNKGMEKSWFDNMKDNLSRAVGSDEPKEE
ncbi:hypothetical protein B484DRAFT_447600 [Ochromonadaceae sp. CCMP2298]|nr:hypothetical protein B484DRAFT_447600 [Ochromonadaceae sp. CCMP2298]